MTSDFGKLATFGIISAIVVGLLNEIDEKLAILYLVIVFMIIGIQYRSKLFVGVNQSLGVIKSVK